MKNLDLLEEKGITVLQGVYLSFELKLHIIESAGGEGPKSPKPSDKFTVKPTLT